MCRIGDGNYTANDIAFDKTWKQKPYFTQRLRQPQNLATVIIEGSLGMDFFEESDIYHRRAVVQYLALFVPWHLFLLRTENDINTIWDEEKSRLSNRILTLVDNI